MLSFYIREGDSRGRCLSKKNNSSADFEFIINICYMLNLLSDKFKLVKIRMEKQSGLNKFIRHVLETCNLPLNSVDKLSKDKPSPYHSVSKENSTSESSAFHSDAIFGTEEFEFLHQKTQRHIREVTLR